jgi:hypothetical protein
MARNNPQPSGLKQCITRRNKIVMETKNKEKRKLLNIAKKGKIISRKCIKLLKKVNMREDQKEIERE